MNNTSIILLTAILSLVFDACLSKTLDLDAKIMEYKRKACEDNAAESDADLLEQKGITKVYLKMIGVESCAKIWGSFSAYVHDDHFCVNHDDAYARDILAMGLALYDCAFSETHKDGLRHCFLRIEACDDRRKEKEYGEHKRVWGPPPPMKSLPSTTLTCKTSIKDRIVRSRESDGPIEMTHPSNKKLLDKMEKESAKMKKELLAIDAMERKNSSKSLKKST